MSRWSTPDTLGLSWQVLRYAMVLNILAGILVLAMLVTSFVAPAFLERALQIAPSDTSSSVLLGMRGIMLVGLVSIPLNGLVLARLMEMVESVEERQPFAHRNAERLTQIAWAVLGLQILHVVVVLIGRGITTPATRFDFGSATSLTPWLTVLLLFVLARVFQQGARMNDDLAGIV